jgi:hypothetical protein
MACQREKSLTRELVARSAAAGYEREQRGEVDELCRQEEHMTSTKMHHNAPLNRYVLQVQCPTLSPSRPAAFFLGPRPRQVSLARAAGTPSRWIQGGLCDY